MRISTEALANWFIDRARADGRKLDPMKLQKLMWFAQGWALGLGGAPLVDEYFEAWEYGPVLPSIYHEFKEFGSQTIDRPATIFNLDNWETEAPKLGSDSGIEKLLNKVWDIYGPLSGIQLSKMTHEAGSPWDVTRKNNVGMRNADIPNELIAEFFKAKAAANRAA